MSFSRKSILSSLNEVGIANEVEGSRRLHSLKIIEEQFQRVPDGHKYKIIADNAVRLYKLGWMPVP